MRLASRAQEDVEVEELRRDCPFPAYIISNETIRSLIRSSNPSMVAAAFRQARERWNAEGQAWSPTLCRKMTIRIWKTISSPTKSETVKAPMRLNKKQAAEALNVSLRTLANMMKDGRVSYTKIETDSIFKQSVSFTYADLYLSEPMPKEVPLVVVPLAVAHPAPRPEPVYDYPSASEQSIIWVEGPDRKEVGFTGDKDGKSAEQRAQKYRQQLAAQQRRF